MFTIIMFLSIASTLVEMMIVYKNKKLRAFFTEYTNAGLIFSFVLSFAMGAMFGMGGLIAGSAAVISTVMSSIIYNLHLLDAWEVLMKGCSAAKETIINMANGARDAGTKIRSGYNSLRHPIRSRSQ